MEDSVKGGDDVRESTPEPLDASTLVQWFENAEEASSEERRLAERDRDYYDNIQWTEEEIKALEKRKQPVVTINRIKRKIDYLSGHERKTRTDPIAMPRTPKHAEAAHAVTDALRFVADKTRFNQVKSKVWEDVLVEGLGGVIVTCKETGNSAPDISIKRVPWDRLFRDPHAREQDFSDAQYTGIVTWMDFDDAARRWPDSKDRLEALVANSNSKTYEDRPKYRIWADGKRKRVRICEIYYRHDGVWFQAFFTEGGLLGTSEPCKYIDQDGEPDNPMVMVSAYCNRDNERYGVVRELISSQDEINKRRSKALHLLTMRQVVAERGAVADINAARRELAKPDGIVELNPGPLRFEILETGDQARGQFELLAHATAEIDLAGPNAAMSGKDERAPSGRAILANQQGGAIEMEPLLDAIRDWQRRVMEKAWARIRQYWTAETWIRVTDDEKNLQWVGLNTPVMQDGPFGPVPGVQNNVAEMMVDITIMEAPDTANLQSEQFEQIVQLAANGVAIPPDILIEMSSLRNKDAILERMKPNPEQAQAEAAEAKAKQDAVFEAELNKTNSETEKNQAQAMATVSGAQVNEAKMIVAESQPQIVPVQPGF